MRDDKLVSGYIRMEQKSGLIGIYEKRIPTRSGRSTAPGRPRTSCSTPIMTASCPGSRTAMGRMPIFAELGLKREVHGAISHPPDGNPLIGPAPGVGQLLVLLRHPDRHRLGPGPDPRACPLDGARRLRHLHARISIRAGSAITPPRTGRWSKAKEDYCLRHEIPFPHFNRLAGRPIKPSPLYERLKEKGAVYEEVYGHERPRWFAVDGVSQEDHYSFRRNVVHDARGPPRWQSRARRRSASWTFPPSPRSKLAGPDAEALLDRLVANRLPQKGRRHRAHPSAEPPRPHRDRAHRRQTGRRPLLSGLRRLLRAASDGPSAAPASGRNA